PLKMPAALIYGDKSHLIHQVELRYMKKKYGIQTFETHGSHMFPMEHPAVCATMVISVIDSLLGSVDT
ncbi:MAG: alpha/beta hydrolase, partial [Legionellales bacterium]